MADSLQDASRDFRQTVWDEHLAAHVAARARDWLAEDLGHECDWTSVATVPGNRIARLNVVCRRPGVIAGLDAAGVVASVADGQLDWRPLVVDGARTAKGDVVATLAGPVRSVLAAERVILNMIGRMSGVATATRQLVDAVAGTRCRVYDTRKTVPGWRLLDKLATRLGGGWNHRLGLHDAILVKDNHLAALAAAGSGPADAVRKARTFIATAFPADRAEAMVVEIEVDSLAQLELVLPAGPDIVLLDNMPLATLVEAVAIRDRMGPADGPRVILEASGGIRPDTVRDVAETGVDRVSSGWPTHDAPWLDVGLDWPESPSGNGGTT
ncbi:MAG: carboxylating nicotinate-nucleotide diphosphorylase [Planctomycetia bacterium]|nr:carboxylating nicotinate-nucleotide diphosphorylase [Planctomycetia bacterium]